MIRYIIIPKEGDPFISDYFTVENCYSDGMIVIDLAKFLYTKDGLNWLELEIDHL